MTARARDIGNLGEALARAYLEKRGYKIIRQNVRSPFGEIDLIAKEKDTLVFIEVKTRSSHAFGHPAEAVTPSKKERLVRLSEWYLSKDPQPHKAARIDVLAITLTQPPQFDLIQNAIDG